MAAGIGSEVGSTGLNWAVGGTIQEEINTKLSGRQAILVYREMSDNDPLVSAIMYAIDMLVRQVTWNVEQADAKEQDVEFLEGCMHDMSHSWSDFIAEIMSMLRYGWSFHEIVYKRRLGPQRDESTIPTSMFNDRKIGWRKMPIRSQDSLDHWDFDETTGALRAMVQKPPPEYTEKAIPITKGLLFRTTVFKNNPEGRSLLRGAYRPWYFKKRIEEIEGIGIERDMAGMPKFNIPAEYLGPSATPDMQAFVERLVQVGRDLRRDKQESIIWPVAYDQNGNKLWEFELMASSGTRTFDTNAVIGRYNQAIAMTVLADFILLGHEKVGSFALSSDKTDIFAIALGTILDIVQDVINRFAVPRLWRLNGWDESKAPQITHGDIEDRDLASLGTFLQVLSTIGMPLFPDDDLDKYIRVAAKLPERSEETKQIQEEQKAQQEADAQQQFAPQDQTQQDSQGAISFQ